MAISRRLANQTRDYQLAAGDVIVAARKANSTKAAQSMGFNPDRPIDNASEDQLGFSAIAESLAKSVTSGSASQGLVVGIEGKWGSGKSSILNLLTAQIQNVENLSILRFDPWVIGDRDAMVSSLIGDLAAEIVNISANADSIQKVKIDAARLARQLRTYGANASRGLSKIAQLASLAGIPGGDMAAKALEVTGQLLSTNDPPMPLASQRRKIFKSLQSLRHRFVVLVDDLDRLEPAEATEILRLIRAVGDFPNVVYLLSYDKDVLAKSLTHALGVEDGYQFLRKVVQVSFPVPKPEEFDLRRWLRSELHILYQAVSEKTLDEETSERLAQICDKEGGLLRTPRDIGHVLNAIRLAYPPVLHQVDFADMCWLQITRITNEKLYRWVEHYLDLFAAIAGRYGMVHEGERKSMFGDLLACLEAPFDHVAVSSMWRISELLPGIGPLIEAPAKDSKERVLFDLNAKRLSLLEQHRRLGSPQHYRFYFSFSLPTGALDDETFRDILRNAEQGLDVAPRLRELIDRKRKQGGTLYGVFLDRLGRTQGLNEDTLGRLIMALGNTVDDAERTQPQGGPFGAHDYWRSAHDLLKQHLRSLGGEPRQRFIAQLFKGSCALGWLMEAVIGKELFDHGRVGSPRAVEEDRLLSPAELDAAIEIVFARMKGKDKGRLADIPQLMVFLHRWKQAGGEEAMKKWAALQMSTDTRFLDLLEKCRGWRASDKVYFPLVKRDVSIFIDFDSMIARLKMISKKKTTSDTARAKAKELLQAAELGRKSPEDF